MICSKRLHHELAAPAGNFAEEAAIVWLSATQVVAFEVELCACSWDPGHLLPALLLQQLDCIKRWQQTDELLLSE